MNYAGTRIIKETYIFKNVAEFIRKTQIKLRRNKESSITKSFDMWLENNAMLAISNYRKVIVFFSISFYTLLIKVRCISFVIFLRTYLHWCIHIWAPFFSVVCAPDQGFFCNHLYSQLFPESTKDERRLIENKLKKEV
jgi:hypothetical protein